jgi:hypothetical protein
MPLISGLKQFGRYSGMVVVTGFPLVGSAIPRNWQTILVFPPLGGMNHLLEPFASLLIAASGIYAVNLRKRRSPSTKFRRGFFVAIAGFVLYTILVLSLVVRIGFPDGTYQYRSIGFQRTQLGRSDRDLKNAPAAQAIKVVGTEEEAIETVWEPWSIHVAQFLLFTSYVLTLGSFNFGIGALKLSTLDTPAV